MKQLAAIVAVLAVLLGAALWIARGSGTTAPTPDGSGAMDAASVLDLDFPPFVLDVDALAPTWDAERDSLRELEQVDAELLAAWQRQNYATGVAARDLFEGDAALLRSDFEARRRAWAAMRTADEYLALGWEAYGRFESALTELLRFARMTDTPLADALGDPLLPVVHAYYESCGDFLDGAMQFGLVGPTGELNVQPELILVMFRYRWMWDASEIWPAENALPGLELREFLRWRIEDAALSPDARLALIERYTSEFGFERYPVEFARAVAHAKSGNAEAALDALRAARGASPDNPIVIDAWSRITGP